MTVPKLELQGVSKSFGRVAAVANVSLRIPPGTFVALLGPSGCGKTTLLRLITGYLRPDSGRVIVDGEDVTHLPTHRRNMGMVFQSFALFPHLTVAENVAFPLRVRRVPPQEQRTLIRDALSMVHLEGYAEAYPRHLSGGQQQRVGLARAIVFRPTILLLDEPLSNLDAALREELRVEISQVTRRLGITSVYVTHDQREAFALADVIAVMNQGRVVQVGSPEEIYRQPASRFVADFIGHSNCLSVQVSGGVAVVGGGAGVLEGRVFRGISGPATVFIHAGDVQLMDEGQPGPNCLRGRVLDAAFTGDRVEYLLEIEPGLRLRSHAPVGHDRLARGAWVWARLPADKLILVHDDPT
jgi:ABC-type Fe3+/spermidine/putrescine transport system ATPase subunit